MLNKTLTYGRLFDFYGPLLTERQQEIIRAYFYQDFSLAEIAENLEISRQAVYDHLQRAEKQLVLYEEKLGLLSRYKEVQAESNQILQKLEEDDSVRAETRQEIKTSVEKIKSCL